MTQDERNMLTDLANKIAQTPAPPRDPDAEDFIRKNIGSRPDALYLMTQTVLIQNMALQQAQHQIQELQQRMAQPVPSGQAGAGGFLGGGQASQFAPPRPQYAPPPQYASPAPQYASAPAPPSAGSFAPPPSGMSGFLRGAAQTAAGVAAGTLAVQGIESLFSSHEGFGGGGMFGGGGGAGGNETIIENNYYDQPQDAGGSHFADSQFDNSGQGFDDASQQDSDYDDSSALGDDSSFGNGGDNFS